MQSVYCSCVCLCIYSVVPLKEKIVLLAKISCDIFNNVSNLFVFLADVAVCRLSRTQDARDLMMGLRPETSHPA